MTLCNYAWNLLLLTKAGVSVSGNASVIFNFEILQWEIETGTIFS